MNDVALVTFTVFGKPGPGGSKKGMASRSTGRIIVVDSGGKTTRSWSTLR